MTDQPKPRLIQSLQAASKTKLSSSRFVCTYFAFTESVAFLPVVYFLTELLGVVWEPGSGCVLGLVSLASTLDTRNR